MQPPMLDTGLQTLANAMRYRSIGRVKLEGTFIVEQTYE